MEITKNLDNLLQRENCFKHSIQMAFQDLITWPTLISILEDMTPTLVECKQLIKVLLNELQMLKHQKQIENSQDVQNVYNEELFQDKASDDIEVLEEEFKLDDLEIPSVQDTTAKDFENDIVENLDEDSIDIKVDTTFISQKLNELYTFVGSDNEDDDTEQYENLELTSSSRRRSQADSSTNEREISNVSNELPSEENVHEEKAKKLSMISKLKHEPKRFECKLCKNEFSRSYYLKVHERLHTGEKPFECQTCKKCFSRSHHLIAHQNVHTGEKPFECKTCNKMFSRAGVLKIHQRSHTGKKPFECEQCKMTFNQKSHLKLHERNHTGEKPYECKYCKKCFAALSSLKLHERTHTGEVPYECFDCGKRFKDSSFLKRHKIVHSDERPFECQDCGREFKSNQVLKRHQKKLHRLNKYETCSKESVQYEN